MVMKYFLNLLLFTFLMGAFVSAHSSVSMAQSSFAIAATVNKSAISESDVNDRLKLTFASSGVPKSNVEKNSARTQALNLLIEEELKIQEAERQNLSVTKEEIDVGFANLAKQNNMTADQFKIILEQQGIPVSTLRQQVKAQLAWIKVVTQVLRPKVDVSENDINAKMALMKDKIGATEYNAFDIFLPVTNESEEAKIKELAEKIIAELKAGRAPFEMAAAQFSKSETAPRGGSLGWVKEGDLPKELDLAVRSLSKGQISPPIRGLGGYYILTVKETRIASKETLPSEDEMLNTIGLERLERLATRYLSDIKSAAFIDRRG